MDISVVVPLYNEEESLPELYSWIERVMRENNFYCGDVQVRGAYPVWAAHQIWERDGVDVQIAD